MKKRDKSGYERGVLLELRIARSAAWALYLVLIVLIVLYALDITHYGFWKFVLAEAVTAVAAVKSAQCEYAAEKQLKDIWEAEGLDRLVNG